jgi:hypothetical protein
MNFACDHDATRASFDSFLAGTKLIGGMPDGEGGWLLLGTCTKCETTLAKPIAEPRGNTVHGTIEAEDEPPPVRCPPVEDDDVANLIR